MTHQPVMLDLVLKTLQPCAGEIYIDGTFGYGGYSQGLLQAADCKVIAMDRDPHVKIRVTDLSRDYGVRFDFIETEFSKLDTLDLPAVDGIILDIGVSSMQLDEAARGFAIKRDGPLDMRMSGEGVRAYEAVRYLPCEALQAIFKHYGEERQARRIANYLVRARSELDIDSTTCLARLVCEALGRTDGSGRLHPATRVFQALRIFINDELGELYRGLCASERLLKPGGRLIVVSFHSLEDRIVKNFLRRRAQLPLRGSRYDPEPAPVTFEASFKVPYSGIMTPDATDIKANPRARSAKLRWAVRTSARAFMPNDQILPDVPSIAMLEGKLQ